MWEIQLRKGCRFLAAAQHCLLRPPRPGFYAGAVELAFAAIERTLQSVLMRQERVPAEDFRSHLHAMRQAGLRELVPPDLARVLEDLWLEFRNENYYRSGVPDRAAATTLVRLAERLHRQLVGRRAEYRGSCTCRRSG